VISVLDVFSVAAYDREECKTRLATHLQAAFSGDDEEPLAKYSQRLDYGWDQAEMTSAPRDQRLWSEVLDAVDRVHEATEKKHKQKGRRGGRTLPIVDYLPSLTPQGKHAKSKRNQDKHGCVLS
jgi:hypothetical protein